MDHVQVVAFLCDSGVVDTDGTVFCAEIEDRAAECVELLVRRRGGHIGMDAPAYTNIAKGRDSLITCTFDMGAVVLPEWRGFCSTKEPN